MHRAPVRVVRRTGETVGEAFAVADVFLRLNGHRIVTSTDDAYDVIIEVFEIGMPSPVAAEYGPDWTR